MRRKIVPGCGIFSLSDHSYPKTPIAAETPLTVTSGEKREKHVAGFFSEEAADSSVNSPVNQPSPRSVRNSCASLDPGSQPVSPLGYILTPTSSESELSFLCLDDKPVTPPLIPSFIPPSATWINPFLSAEESIMPPAFDINQRPPFQDPMESLGVQPYDVLKIINVPYSVTVPEIKQFIGRLTTSELILPHQQGYPVHIIMDRPTGKTMDCFVEFQHKGAARAAYHRAEKNTSGGKVLRMGSRHVEVEISSEGELCATLFPRAKSTHWDPESGVPTVVVNQDPFSEGFRGFFTIEEITSVCKHAANPQKMSTSGYHAQQRVYESMISTLYKFPWHVPQHYSVNARNFLWSAYMELLSILVGKVKPGNNGRQNGSPNREVGLSHSLLMDYIFCGLNVQMFSLRQKFMIIHASGPLGAGFGIPRQSSAWPFQALIPSANCPPEVIDKWLNILDAGYEKATFNHTKHAYSALSKLSRDETGYLRVELTDLGRTLSFRELISMEKGLMEFLVEQGRVDWCAAYRVPYQKLNLWGQPPSFSQGYRVGPSTQSLDPARLASKGGEQCVDENSDDDYACLYPNDPDDIACSGDDDGHAINAVSGRAYDDDVAAANLNPATPPFIPSQPWNSANNCEGRSNMPSENRSQQAHPDNYDLALALAPSWASPQELSSSRRSSIKKSTPRFRAQQHDLGDDRSPYDPFHNDASPQGHRRTSLKSDQRSASASPGNSITSVNPISRYGSEKSGGDSDLKRLRSALAPRPIFGSIWGPDLSGTPPVPTSNETTPSRRSASAESIFANGSPVRSTRSNSDVVVAQSDTIFNTTDFPFMPAPASAQKQATAATDFGSRSPARESPASREGSPGSGWQTQSYAAAVTSKPKGSLSKDSGRGFTNGKSGHSDRRSSTGRHTIHIQATIVEESEASPTETTDGNDDAAADVGGVRLGNDD